MIALRARLVISIFALLLTASVVTAGNSSVRPPKINLPQESSDGARRVKPEEARELWGKGKAVLVDVRGDASYRAGHIKGALNIPAGDIRARAKELPPGKMILAYCS